MSEKSTMTPGCRSKGFCEPKSLSVLSYETVFNILAGTIILALIVFVPFWHKEKKDEKV